MYFRFSPEALPYEATPVDNLFLLEYMPQADGRQLSVYLYGLMLCRYPSFDFSSIQDVLNLTDDELLQAFAYWQQQGLVKIVSVDPLEVEYVSPEERARGAVLLPGQYPQLVQAAQSLFAPRSLRPQEIRRMYDWVEVFGLEEEAVLELISHCIERKGEKVSMAYIDTVARAWADDGVRTSAEARKHADNFKKLVGGARDLLKHWNKSRMPTNDELAMYEKWVGEWGFTKEAVLTASRELTKADKPTFAYLNTVLKRMHEMGAHDESSLAGKLAEQSESAELSHEVFSAMDAGRSARPLEREQLLGYLGDGVPKELLLFAAEQSRSKDRPLGYFKKLMNAFKENNVNDIAGAQKYINERETSYKSGKSGRGKSSSAYPQKRYTEKELDHLFINLNEEC